MPRRRGPWSSLEKDLQYGPNWLPADGAAILLQLGVCQAVLAETAMSTGIDYEAGLLRVVPPDLASVLVLAVSLFWLLQMLDIKDKMVNILRLLC